VKPLLCDQITNAQVLNLVMFFNDKFYLGVKLSLFTKPFEFSLLKYSLIEPQYRLCKFVHYSKIGQFGHILIFIVWLSY